VDGESGGFRVFKGFGCRDSTSFNSCKWLVKVEGFGVLRVSAAGAAHPLAPAGGADYDNNNIFVFITYCK
jgi:hypothetical protein